MAPPKKGAHLHVPKEDGSVYFGARGGPLAGAKVRMYPDNLPDVLRKGMVGVFPPSFWCDGEMYELASPLDPSKPMYEWIETQ